MRQRTTLPPALMAVFALSGFSGLIYQSIWTQYLGLVLGHAAFAQTLVLAIYMGGLALGSWLAARRVASLANPVLTYAIVEGVIGLWAFVFHPLFVAYVDASQASVLPHLAGASVGLYQWGTSALLILPQCILLGTTFPLMAAGVLRLQPDAQARSLGGLYFTNSFGAALGALTATFLLLPHIGMPGAMALAGALNLVVAALAAWLARVPTADAMPAVAPAAASTPAASADRQLARWVLIAAALTGATSFMYEIAWVRMLNQVLGTTLHSFELMLAAFILGLAAGAYWIHRRGDASANTLRLAGIVQVWMGVFALGSALAFGQSFHAMRWLLAHVERTDAGYFWFNLGSAAIAMVVMFPTAFFAGATLPLFTTSLLRGGHGERAIGWVYAVNTLGAIAGVLAVVHIMIPAMGIHLSLLFAALVDVALGIALLVRFGGGVRGRAVRVAVAASLVALVVALQFGRVDPLLQVSGVFRTGKLLTPANGDVLFLADGKTATVSVMATPNRQSAFISTNGKPDAGMRIASSAPLGDEVTMLMLGALPLGIHPAPKQVGIIGWGSGLTTHTVLGSDRVERVETVEIEAAMVEGARAFGDRVQRAYTDPRSKLVLADARTHFAAGARRYDVVISEPSNPWVSGVANLFTGEFYGFVHSHLADDGVLVQWVQAYEMNDALLARIVSALLSRFEYVDVYVSNSSDLILVASPKPLPAFDITRLGTGVLRSELDRVALSQPASFTARRLGGRGVLEAYARMQGAKGHSDFYPEVALGAPRARFLNQSAVLLPRLATQGLPVLDVLDGRPPPSAAEVDVTDGNSEIIKLSMVSELVAASLTRPRSRGALAQASPLLGMHVGRLLASSAVPVPPEGLRNWSRHVATLARFGIGALPASDLRGVWIAPTWLAPGQPPEVERLMAAYAAAATRDPRAMQATATAVLESQADYAPEVRAQMLVLAMTGAAKVDPPSVAALERRYRRTLPPDPDSEEVRRFLLAWAAPPHG